MQGYRQWKPADRITGNLEEQSQEALNSELKRRCTRVSHSRDILRWGYFPKGSFSSQEAYRILIQDPGPKNPLWEKIWRPGIWPKVSIFLWLFGHQKILTWDNLIKRSFHGPSICPNCCAHEETQKHLLNDYSLANQLWEKVSFRCQRKFRPSEDIVNTIRE